MVRESDAEIEEAFWRLFGRVMGRSFEPSHYRAADLEEWDSLRHIELIFELEETLGLNVSQEDIPDLYSDTDTVLNYLKTRSPGGG